MGTKSYKYYKGTRKVFSIFWNTSINITGLDFLRRAPDDNFSPVGFLPDTKDVDGDGKIEVGLPGREDGLAHPTNIFMQMATTTSIPLILTL